MTRRVHFFLIPVILIALACVASAKSKEMATPEEAKADPDFAIQGEYVGQADGKDKVGAQVIARGDGKFDVVIYTGGLPGDGWKRGVQRVSLQGVCKGETTTLSGAASGKIAGGVMTVTDEKNGRKLELKRTERQSPTLGEKPPAGAEVLFGPKVNEFKGGTATKDGYLNSRGGGGPLTKKKFGDYQLHVEFRLPYLPKAGGQHRGNSGVYLHDCYEIQVLDSFGLEGLDNECGGFYQLRKPDVNMCFPPLQWQTYDMEFTAPKYEGEKKVANARITVRHNGVVIHKDLELPRHTPGRQKEGPPPRPFYLQDHGNQVYYNNVWVVEKKL